MAESLNSNKRNQVFVQAGILAAASMVVRIIGLLYRAPLTAIIGDEGNGYYGTAYNIYAIILMVSSYSVPSAISKLMAQRLALGEYRNAQRIFHCALIYGCTVGLAGGFLLYFGAGALVPDVATGVLRVFAPTVFFFGLLGALRGYFQAHGSMVQTSVSQILEQIANAAVSIGAAWLLMRLVSGASETRRAQYGAMGSALGTGAGVLAALFFMTFAYICHRREIRERVLLDKSGKLLSWGQTMRQTVLVITPFMLSGFILNLTTSLNQTVYYRIMILLKGMDRILATTEYGIFSNKAVVISNIPISIATAVSAAIIPGISAAFAKRDTEEAQERAGNAARITGIITIPSFVGLFFLSRPITMLMFPQMASLNQASGLLSLLSVTVVFYSISTITNAVLQSIGRMNIPLVSAGIALVVQTIVLVILLLFTDLGIWSLVIVSILYSFMIFIINEICLFRYLGMKPDFKRDYVRPFLCALVMGLAASLIYGGADFILKAAGLERLYFRNLFATLAALAVAVVLYFYLLIHTGTMSEKEIRQLPKGARIAALLRKIRWLK